MVEGKTGFSTDYIHPSRACWRAAGRSRDGRGRPNSTVPSFRARAVCDPVPAAAASMLGDRPIESAGSRANHSIGYHDQPCVHAQGTVHNHAVLSPPCSTTHPPAPPFIAYRIANGWLARPLGAISTPRQPRRSRSWFMAACTELPCLPADGLAMEPSNIGSSALATAQPWSPSGSTSPPPPAHAHHHLWCMRPAPGFEPWEMSRITPSAAAHHEQRWRGLSSFTCGALVLQRRPHPCMFA